MTAFRQPLTIVEIDFPSCANTYGSAPCTAALSADNPAKCFNTRATCQAVAAYAPSATQTLRFAYNVTGIPRGQTIFPALTSVSTRAAEINASGIDPRTSALGKRARVTVRLQDFTYGDTLTDNYQAQRVSGAAQFSGIGYQPADRGTFFGKLIARQPYYIGKALRVRKGYVGDAIAAMPAANYVITEWSGPDANGVVEITAADVLALADNAKAVAPAVSNGKLLADIAAGAGTLTLTPTGVGAEYPANGYVCIGREVLFFTRAGDVLTLVGGQAGTVTAAHKANDAAQLCLVYNQARPSGVVADLLITYAAVPAAYIDTAAWQAENDRWLASTKFSTIITKPTGVASLIGEIGQHSVMVWWDELAQKIRFRANRPVDVGETPVELSDAASFITGTMAIDRGDDQRITSLIFLHGYLDATGSMTDESNFARAVVSTVTEDLYGQAQIKTVFSRWLGQAGDDAAAASIANHLKNRFQATPKLFEAMLDIKDRASLSLGQVINVNTYLLQDQTGQSLPEQMQVTYLEEKDDRLAIKAQTWAFTGRYGVITATARPDYAASTAKQRAKGTYIVSAATLKFSDGTGPYIIF